MEFAHTGCEPSIRTSRLTACFDPATSSLCGMASLGRPDARPVGAAAGGMIKKPGGSPMAATGRVDVGRERSGRPNTLV